MALYKDVRPIFMPSEAVTTSQLLEQTREFLLNNGMINIGDTVLITMGEHLHEIGGSNTMKILKY